MGRKQNTETDEVIRLWDEGYWYTEIADMLGLGAEKVKMLLIMKGYSVRPIPKSEAWQEEFAKAWNRACGRFKEWKSLKGES